MCECRLVQIILLTCMQCLLCAYTRFQETSSTLVEKKKNSLGRLYTTVDLADLLCRSASVSRVRSDRLRSQSIHTASSFQQESLYGGTGRKLEGEGQEPYISLLIH